MERKFGVFILTHGRAGNVVTVKTLRRCGYTGEIYIVIDDEDDQEQQYREEYGDHVIQFCKEKYIAKTDTMNPENPHNVVVYARNATFDIAKELGLTHFLVLDDDYKGFDWRYIEGPKLKGRKCTHLDEACEAFMDFLDVSGALTVAMAQAGDFIGGAQSGTFKKKILRKAMNSFFCRTDRPFKFMGAINEDTNAYVSLGSVGNLFFTITQLSLVQGLTQQNKGGLTEAYLDSGTFVKSFYTVMLAPSCCRVKQMGQKFMRLHHEIKWENAVPKIISSRYRKEDQHA